MLFLDEPTAGVDPVSRREFWALIYEMASRGITVLATTHYMDEAEYCNMIGMMYNSRLIALNDPDTLKESMQGTLLEVECDDPARAEELLHEVAGVSNVSQHGLILHVTCVTPAVKDEISTRPLNAGNNCPSHRAGHPLVGGCLCNDGRGRGSIQISPLPRQRVRVIAIALLPPWGKVGMRV